LLSDIEIDNIDVSMLDTAAAEYARIKKAGQPTSDADLLIAAYCIERWYTLVTNNVRHFEIIKGLSFVNWIENS
jgi:tRNA(fMet)-specific endonuclease VapC